MPHKPRETPREISYLDQVHGETSARTAWKTASAIWTNWERSWRGRNPRGGRSRSHLYSTRPLARSGGFVCTRDRERHQVLAHELGATWVGDTAEEPPVKLDAAIIFAPAGELVPAALKVLEKGGTLVLGGIHMSPIPSFKYSLIYGERMVRSVANNTREDGQYFLREAARIPVHTHVQTFPFDQVNEALIALKHDAICGAGVISASS